MKAEFKKPLQAYKKAKKTKGGIPKEGLLFV
jgi:hypothetical protein